MPNQDENAIVNDQLNAPEAGDTEIVDSPEAPAADIPQAQVDAAYKAPEPASTARAAAVATPVTPQAASPKPNSPVPANSFGHGIKEASVEGLNLSDRARRTREVLLAEEKIAVILPLLAGEKVGAYKVVNINGYRMEIRKNTPVKVPMTVWNIIANNMKASFDNTANHPLNLNNADKGAQSALGMV